MKVALIKMGAKRRGGLEKYADRIASSFIKKGAEVSFLTTQNRMSSSSAIHSISFPVCRWPGFLRLEQFDRCVKRYIVQNQFDIVFGMERNRFQSHIRAGNGVHAAFLKSRLDSDGPLKYAMCWINPLHRKKMH